PSPYFFFRCSTYSENSSSSLDPSPPSRPSPPSPAIWALPCLHQWLWPSETTPVVAPIPYAVSGKIKGNYAPMILTIGKSRDTRSSNQGVAGLPVHFSSPAIFMACSSAPRDFPFLSVLSWSFTPLHLDWRLIVIPIAKSDLFGP